jgi:ABC-2 type transport system ATP-binding protein
MNGDGRALEIDGVSKRYGDLVALENLTFDVRAGELFGFVGRNGAGKTTTMRIVLGVLNADAGEVRWGGVPLDFATRRRIGYMPEERGLYPRMHLLDQLMYLGELHGMGHGEARRAALQWLERFGLADRRDDELQALSHGNQQRMQLAAALVCAPEVLVLDEPFSGLDPVALDVMTGVLRERADAGVAVVFSSHELGLVERICDRVGIIDRRRMVACGTVAELRAGGPQRLWVDAPMARARCSSSRRGQATRRSSRRRSGPDPSVSSGPQSRALPSCSATWSRRTSRSGSQGLSDPVLILPVVVAAILIVYGRVNRRVRWGNRIAVAGYTVLAITAIVALVRRG